MEITILGWCWSPQRRLTGLRLESETHSAPCLTGLPRSDVAAYFQDPAALCTGLVGRVQLSDASSRVQLIGEVDGEVQNLADIPVPADDRPDVPSGAVRTYAEWLVLCEPGLFPQPEPGIPRIETSRDAPLFSILLATLEPPLYYLHRSIESVLRQHHQSWELCIACDASTSPDLRTYLEQYKQRDPRIKIRFRSVAGGVSQTFNTALSSAAGRYIVPLAPGDELHAAALLEMALFLGKQPETELLYGDEDQIDDEGHRSRPLFKPAFDPDLLLAFNYVGHPIAIRKDIMERAGAYRTECDGARDWDLLLRVSEAVGAGAIRHLPKPLYHARARDSDPAPDFATRRRVLEDHLTRTKRAGSVQAGLFPGSMRLNLKPDSVRRTAVIYRREDGIHQLHAIRRTRRAGIEVYEMVADKLRQVCCSESRLTTWEDLVSDVVVVVNAPIDYLNHAFFEVLTDCAQRPDCGLAGPMVLGSDGRVLSSGLLCTRKTGLLDPFSGNAFASRGYMGLAKATRAVAAVSAHCFAVSRTRLRGVVGISGAGDDDLAGICGRLVQSAHADGLKVLYSPYAVAAVAGPAPPERIVDVCTGPHAPRVNPNIEAFTCPRAIFEQENLS